MSRKEELHGTVIQSVDRALNILEHICYANEPLSIKEISEELGYNRSTVTGLVNTLVAHSFVKKDHVSGKYIQGVKAFALSHNYPIQNYLLNNAMNAWREMAKIFPELDGLMGLYDEVGKVVAIPVNSYLGEPPVLGTFDYPIHASGSGKCWLAYMPEDEVAAIIKRNGLPKYTENTITNEEELRRELALVRERGYALDNAEGVEDVHCVAVPLLNSRGEIIAAMSLTGHTQTWENYDHDSVVKKCVHTSKVLSGRAFN